MSVRRLAPEAIQPSEFTLTADNKAWADAQIAKYPQGRQASAVIPLLWRAQKQGGGWVSRAAIEHVAGVLDMPKIRVLEVATFYTMFNLEPVGRHHVQLCGTTPCALRGAEALKKVCERKIGPQKTVTADRAFSWIEVECLGACCNAPMAQINDDFFEDLTPESFETLLDDLAAGRAVKIGPQNGRRGSEPEGAVTTLADSTLYDGSRLGAWRKRFERAADDATMTTPVDQTAAAVAQPAAAAAARPESATPTAAAGDTPAATGEASAAKGSAARAADIAAGGPGLGGAPVAPMAAPATTPVGKRESEAGSPAAAGAPAATAGPHPPSPGAPAEAPGAEPRAPESDKPSLLMSARGEGPDDLKLIWGVGPKLETMLNRMGIFHFDQIAGWTADNLNWVDRNLTGFRGRAERDRWIEQAKKLATGWRPAKGVGDRPEGV